MMAAAGKIFSLIIHTAAQLALVAALVGAAGQAKALGPVQCVRSMADFHDSGKEMGAMLERLVEELGAKRANHPESEELQQAYSASVELRDGSLDLWRNFRKSLEAYCVSLG